ncbi:MAG: TlpA family protein disulfide reductase [Lewinella sp.]|uniref:TlpA family protein disulfide reductase n=1 Tax=Lewinella sp. TaxID=2004506 RepID=UPI003D6AED6F
MNKISLALLFLLSLVYGCSKEETKPIVCPESDNLGFQSYLPDDREVFLYENTLHEQLIFENAEGDTLGFYMTPFSDDPTPSVFIGTIDKNESKYCNGVDRINLQYQQENYGVYYNASIGNRSIGFNVNFFAKLKDENFDYSSPEKFDQILSIYISLGDYSEFQIKISEDYETSDLITDRGPWTIHYQDITLNNKSFNDVFLARNKDTQVVFVYSLDRGLLAFIDENEVAWTFSHYSSFPRDIAFDFTLPNREGEEVSFYESEGELILLDFWASWCIPCIEEIQSTLIPLHEMYSDQGLTIVSVSIDQDQNEWEDKLDELEMEWLQLLSASGWQSPLFLNYEIYFIPTIYVIDREKNILSKKLRGEELKTFVEEYLN